MPHRTSSGFELGFEHEHGLQIDGETGLLQRLSHFIHPGRLEHLEQDEKVDVRSRAEPAFRRRAKHHDRDQVVDGAVRGAGRVRCRVGNEDGERAVVVIAGLAGVIGAQIVRDEQIRLGRPVTSMVVHRDGRCWQSEIDGAIAAVEKLRREGIIAPEGTLTILKISKSAPVRLRLFEVQRTHGPRPFVQNPQVGLYTIVNSKDGYLCSTGRAFPRRGTVQPLHVRCVVEGIPFVQALEDVYALTVLAWTRPEDCSRYPVTLKLTDRWLGEEASEFDEEALIYETEENQEQEEERASA